jgi:hypothetical protein
MPRDHFSKAMQSPRFHTDAYKESKEAQIEEKVENFLRKIKKNIKSIFTKRA